MMDGKTAAKRRIFQYNLLRRNSVRLGRTRFDSSDLGKLALKSSKFGHATVPHSGIAPLGLHEGSSRRRDEESWPLNIWD